MPLNLPKFEWQVPIVSERLTASQVFHIWWQSVVSALESAFSSLEAAVLDIAAAQAAADTAQAAAVTAQAAADTAQAGVDATNLATSGTTGLTLFGYDNGADAGIDISAHTRLYSDGTSVLVNADQITGLAYTTTYYVYYDDPTRAGGAVAYQTTLLAADAAQTSDRHLVGRVTTPAAAGPNTDGDRNWAPGLGNLAP